MDAGLSPAQQDRERLHQGRPPDSLTPASKAQAASATPQAPVQSSEQDRIVPQGEQKTAYLAHENDFHLLERVENLISCAHSQLQGILHLFQRGLHHLNLAAEIGMLSAGGLRSERCELFANPPH